MKKTMTALAALGMMIGVIGGAHAATELIQNGGFETLTTTAGGTTAGGPGQLGRNTFATGWTTTGYNFVFAKGTADTTGATGQNGKVTLWGPGNGSANGLTASSPNGNNFVGADGAYKVGAIKQTVANLVVGKTYALSFYWGAAQQHGFTGPTTDKWTVSLGNQSHTTAIDSLASHGFAGWTKQTFNYTATATSEVLSFLATGTPTGEPPFALLDGVSMSVVPEPSSFAAMFVGVLGLCVIVRLRARSKKSAA